MLKGDDVFLPMDLVRGILNEGWYLRWAEWWQCRDLCATAPHLFSPNRLDTASPIWLQAMSDLAPSLKRYNGFSRGWPRLVFQKIPLERGHLHRDLIPPWYRLRARIENVPSLVVVAGCVGNLSWVTESRCVFRVRWSHLALLYLGRLPLIFFATADSARKPSAGGHAGALPSPV